MEILPKFAMEFFWVILAASAALFAQSGGPPPRKSPSLLGVLDASRIVGLSLAATGGN
jgi:hypothetical protein